MSRRIISVTLLILVLLSVPSIARRRITVEASPSVIHFPDDGFLKIQDAINYANESDTILVRNGTYFEHVDINKSISLIGTDGRGSTFIDGMDSPYVVSITADNVYLEGFTIQKNSTVSEDRGVSIASSGNTLNNTKITNAYYGVTIDSSSSNILANNIIIGNHIGIAMSVSTNNTLFNNTIAGNYDGMDLSFSSSNILHGNTVFNNYENALALFFGCAENLVYHNNLGNVALFGAGANTWSFAGEGNRWLGYNGTDLDNDGIGDEPYSIDLRNQDSHPLLGMFYSFEITLENKQFPIDIISNSTVSNLQFAVGEETGNRIVHFNVEGSSNMLGFCRVALQTEFMDYPFILLDGGREIAPRLLSISNETNACLYITYANRNQSITVISSKTLRLYNDLFASFAKLQTDLNDINATFSDLLDGIASDLRLSLDNLNGTYYELSRDYYSLLQDYYMLQQMHSSLNASYQDHLADFSISAQNLRNLEYILAAWTAIFLITIVYLSRGLHAKKPQQ